MRRQTSERGPLQGGDLNPPLVLEPADAVRRPHFKELDSFRTIAAMALALLHLLSFSDLTDPSFSSRVIYYFGHLNGMLFFPLSGFLVFRPLVSALLDRRPQPSAVDTWRRRFWRIFPAYWLVLTILLFIDPDTLKPHGAWQVFSVYTLLNLLFPKINTLGLGQTWTLGVELVFYLLVPFAAAGLAALVRSGQTIDARYRRILSALVVALLAFWALKFALAPLAAQFRSDLYMINKSFYSYLDAFVLGMLVATLREGWVRGIQPPRFVRQMVNRPLLSWSIAAGLGWWVIQLHRPPVPSNTYMTTMGFVTHLILLSVACTFLIGPFCFHVEQRGLAATWLGGHIMRSLAPFTYGFYLWHFGVIHKMNHLWGEPHGVVEVAVRWALVCAVSMLLGALTHSMFEKPVLEWAAEREKARSAAATAGGAADTSTTELTGGRSTNGEEPRSEELSK